MAYPDPKRYQQLNNGDPHGPVNCTAWCGAWLVDASSDGRITTTGEKVRAASSEPKPDPSSPGLNLPQVDAAVFRLTRGRVSLDTRVGYSSANAQARIIDGRWAIVQVNRGVLVKAGDNGANDFTGGHAETVHYSDGAPRLGDPLVGHYIQTTWSVLWRAAGKLVTGPGGSQVGDGRANVSFTRDTTRDYAVSIQPRKGRSSRGFYRFVMSADGHRISGRVADDTGGFTADCTPPKYYDWPGHEGRSLVQITSGSRRGAWVNSHWSDPE